MIPSARSILMTSLAALGLTAPMLAQGDDCLNATVIAGLGPNLFTTALTNTTSGFDGGGGWCQPSPDVPVPDRDVFFQWTAQAEGTHLFSLQSMTGGVINLHQGVGCSATCVNHDAVDATEDGAYLKASTQPGDAYLIQVGCWATVGPQVQSLTISLVGPTPVADDCATPTKLYGPGTHLFNTSACTDSFFDGGSSACQPFGELQRNDLFIEWTALASGSMNVGTHVDVYRGVGCSAVCVSGQGVPTNYPVELGEKLLLQVGSSSLGATSPGGGIIVNVYAAPGSPDCSDPSNIAGDGDFPVLVKRSLNQGSQFTGGGTAADGGIPCSDVLNDLFVIWEVECPGHYELILNSPYPSPMPMRVYRGSDCSASCESGGANDPIAGMPVAEVDAQAGELFLLQIGSTTSSAANVQEGVLTITRTGAPCNGTGFQILCDPPSPNTAGRGVTLATSTLGHPGESGLLLEATGGPPGSFGFVLVSDNGSGSTPLGQGTLCLNGFLGRYDGNFASNQGLPELDSLGFFNGTGRFTSLMGNGANGTDLGFVVPTELPSWPIVGTIDAGEAFLFQVWYRDTDAGLPSSNMSDMLEIVFP